MKKFTYYLAVTLFCAFIIGTASAEKINILYVSDTHANLTPGGNRDSELKATKGGIARLASYVGMEKMQNPSSLFFHGGDFSIGDIMYCKNFAVPELQILRSLGCNAIELGNHEFDLTPPILTMILGESFKDGAIPILCANADFSDPSLSDLKNLVQPYKIFEKNGVKIGVFGLITPSTVQLSNPSPVNIQNDSMTFVTAGMMAYTLREQGCQVVILISHLGYLYDYQLAGMVPGIDVILGAHDHFAFQEEVKVENPGGTITHIVQTGAFLQNVGKLVLDVTNNEVKLDSYTLQPLDETITEEPTVKGILDALIADIETTYGQPFYTQKVADCEKDLEEFAANAIEEGNHDTEVGNLVTDAFKAWGQTDIAITATGFTSQKLWKGPIVAADIYRMLGYGFNEVNGLGFRMVKFNIKGSDLIAGISFGLMNLFGSEDYLIQAAGMKYKYEFYQNYNHLDLENNFAAFVSATVGGEPIDPEKMYSVTTHEGLVAFLNLLQIPVTDMVINADNTTEFMVVMGYCQQMQNVSSAVEGRVECTQVTSVKENTPLDHSPAYPTPCVNRTSVNIEIANPGFYILKIYNSQGNQTGTMQSQYLLQGSNSLTIDTSEFMPGIYNFVLDNGTELFTGRIVVVK
jgi:2',3'-cyclic-nucleotide 2'-phosphodiesterase (5'-nucleotidase family)